MNYEKEVKKMAEDLYVCHDEYVRDGDDWVTDYNSTAKRLYKRGYRKAEDVAREIFEEIEKLIKRNAFKGFSSFQYDLAELKKKYTEDGE